MMRTALVGLLWAQFAFGALIVGAGLFGWCVERYATRRSRRERADIVQRVEDYRTRLEWEARGRRSTWDRQHHAKQKTSARLLQFRARHGGTPAA